jgi:hypothetical protein
MNTKTKPDTSAFNHLAMLAIKRNGGEPVRETTFTFDIKGRWIVVVNGHQTPKKVYPRNCQAMEVKPYSMSVWHDGVYVGYFGPNAVTMLEEKLKRDPSIRFGLESFDRIVLEELSGSDKAIGV